MELFRFVLAESSPFESLIQRLVEFPRFAVNVPQPPTVFQSASPNFKWDAVASLPVLNKTLNQNQ
jgi:hypothetical protein